MPECADLEIALHRYDTQHYFVTLRFAQPVSAAEMMPHGGDREDEYSDIRLGRQKILLVSLDLEKLRTLENQAEVKAYGKELSDALFNAPGLGEDFAKARAIAAAQDLSLRVRLFIDPGSPELHELHWERLLDPEYGTPLLTGERVLFSRYLSSWDPRSVPLRSHSELRALMVLANPPILASKGRAIDIDKTLTQVRNALGGIKTEELLGGEEGTLNNLFSRLREDDHPFHLRKGYDILYLVCHGEFWEGKPRLWLEGMAPTDGTELIARFRELRQQPTLVVLASCQSAGKGDGGALAALGPQLADAGVAAVVAMQGDILEETVAQFMPEFFKATCNGKAVDEAMAIARGAVRDKLDWWVPVLFMRLRSGHIWYVPHTSEQDFPWDNLTEGIQNRECIPILGPGLTDSLIGSRREIAQGLAEDCGFPFTLNDREDLPQVAQFIAVYQGNKNPIQAPRRTLTYLCNEILARYGKDLQKRLAALRVKEEPLSKLEQDLLKKLPQYLSKKTTALEMEERMEMFDLLLEEVWGNRKDDPTEPHQFLANLPFDIYITTNPDNLLAKALTNTKIQLPDGGEAYKTPVVELCRWNDSISRLPSIFNNQEQPYEPDKNHPLVYHLFGRINKPEQMVAQQDRYANLLRSVVLTEDDYFDFLIGTTKNKVDIPKPVRGALASRTLMFVGFRMDDWNFRVLFRSIMNQEGAALLQTRPDHVAVQIDPEESRVQYPERARHYLEERFERANIHIFWGSTDDFIRKLYEAWQKKNS